GISLFTGFAESDNIFLPSLKGQQPVHVLNFALNITKGHRLAWQNRKAACFSASPYGVGSFLQDPETMVELGYRRPEHYTDGGLSLGTAVAVSGAAASPNMGFHTSTVLSFLLTFFNLRLGAWFPNPSSSRQEIFAKNGPGTPDVVLKELLGMTHERSDWIYLSDGGHFENLALYEMIKRRCRLIVLSDAGADPNYSYEDLGNAVHKARVDMNVSIEFAGERQLGDACRAQHWSLLRVRYPDQTAGLILYLKPAISPELSADVLSYSAANREFPQQTTGDQFFDEGQFEAYRRLGEQTVEMIGRGCPEGDLEALFEWASEKFPRSS
ncbi:MAG: hypothetical protein SFV51_31560, partial [Bryobacteraceae bacterium]|nr:hypothetical protein [Bryobacteraceae bacterium]